MRATVVAEMYTDQLHYWLVFPVNLSSGFYVVLSISSFLLRIALPPTTSLHGQLRPSLLPLQTKTNIHLMCGPHTSPPSVLSVAPCCGEWHDRATSARVGVTNTSCKSDTSACAV